MSGLVHLVEVVLSAGTAFVATNIDDVVVLMLLFSRVKSNSKTFTWANLVLGQYLGYFTLVLMSLPAAIGGMLMPQVWIGWLGLVPIGLGLKEYFYPDDDDDDDSDSEDESESDTSDDDNTSRRRSRKSSGGSTKSESKPRKSKSQEKKEKLLLSPKVKPGTFKAFLSSFISIQAYQVAAITIGNGGDNVAVYIPLFAASSAFDILVILITFFFMVGGWCYFAFYLSKHPVIKKSLNKYSSTLVPLVLIGLGIWIFVECETYELLHVPLM